MAKAREKTFAQQGLPAAWYRRCVSRAKSNQLLFATADRKPTFQNGFFFCPR